MERTWSVPFIGRTDELHAIRTHAQAWGTRRIMFVSGEGGIGKTRLLHEIEREIGGIDSDFPLKLLPVIDFDDDQYKFPQNIGVSISRQFDPAAFESYLESLRKMRALEESSLKEGELTAFVQRQTLTVDRRFIKCFHEISGQQRILLRFDTTDAVSWTVVFGYVHEMGTKLSNVLIVVAGRDAQQLYETYKEEWNQDAFHLPLQPFQLPDSRTYLEQKRAILHVTLDQEWMDKLFILAGGLPVLIDLAIEWAQNHRSLPWLEDLSLAELQQLQQVASENPEARQQLLTLREEFKKVVVLPIADLHTSLDHLKFVLSKVYPLDLEGIIEMLNLNQENAERLMHRAKQSVAVKILPDGRIKLHDEVQRLINQYVWPLLDHDLEWEMRDSRRAISYLARKSEVLLREIRQLRQQELNEINSFDPGIVLQLFGNRREKESTFWSFRIERLRRQLAIDVQAGYKLFQQDYELSREELSSRPYHQSLLSMISKYVDLDFPAADIQGDILQESQRLAIQQQLALHERFNGRYKEAAKIYQQLLKRIPKENEEYVETLNGRANQLVRAGKLREALRANEEALKLSQKFEYQRWIIQSNLELGWVHRLMGNLEQALQYYNNALKLAYQFDNEERIALVFNNLAYVHALQHQDKAINEIQQAIRLWKKLTQEREENRFRLGQCYNIAGEIYLELGRPQESLAYFELSWNIFNRQEFESDERKTSVAEWRSKARSGRGFASWHLAVKALQKDDQDTTQQYLHEALRDLQWAAEYATSFDSPQIDNRLGEVYFLLGNYEATENVWLESLNEARQVGDAFNEFHSLSDLARLAFYHPLKRFPDWRAFETYYTRDYRRTYQSLHFGVLVGLFYTFLGHLAFQAEDASETARLYERGLPVLAEYGTYDPFNLTGQLDFVQRDILPHVAVACIHEVADRLQKFWLDGFFDMLALNYFREWSRMEHPAERTPGGNHA